MSTTTSNSIRLTYGVSKPVPPLPVSYQLTSWYADPGLLAPKQLDITQNGVALDGQPVPRATAVDPFITSWLNDTQNTDDGSENEELALSFYSPNRPVGPFEWGTFEFEEDKKSLIGILGRKDSKGNQTVCYVTGTKLATSKAPSVTPWEAPAPAAPNIDELITLTYPGLTDATSTAMSDDFGWALDYQWRSKLMSKDRPDISTGLPASVASDRQAFLDANAEWFNSVFGPAAMGLQLYQDTQPGAANPVKLTKSLIPPQADTLKSFLNGQMGAMPQSQQAHLMAARTAHFKQNPRLQNYVNDGKALLGRLEQVNGSMPSIVTFLGLTSADPALQSCSIKLTGRYAFVLGALDPTGQLETQLRQDIIAVQLLHPSPNVSFADQAGMESAAEAVIGKILSDPATPADTLTTIKRAVTVAGSAANLAHNLAAVIVSKNSEQWPTDGTRVMRIASGASDAFDLQYPAGKLGVQFFSTFALAWSVYMSVRMYMNWQDMSPADWVSAIFGNLSEAKSLISIGSSVYSVVKAVNMTDAEKAAALKALDVTADTGLSESKTAGLILSKMQQIDPKFVEKASAWLSKLKSISVVDTLKDPSWAKVGDLFSAVGGAVSDGFSLLGKALGPVTAIAALGQSIYSLISDIKSGAGITQIALDSLNVALNTALVVCAVVDLVVEAFAVTVIGIVLVAVALLVTAVVAVVEWILGRHKPPSPPDDYMENVVYPFLNFLPYTGPTPKEWVLEQMQAVFSGKKPQAVPASA